MECRVVSETCRQCSGVGSGLSCEVDSRMSRTVDCRLMQSSALTSPEKLFQSVFNYSVNLVKTHVLLNILKINKYIKVSMSAVT